jgi:hypothetical protein
MAHEARDTVAGLYHAMAGFAQGDGGLM